MKWEHSLGHFIGKTDCTWEEYQNGQLLASYKLVKLLNDDRLGESIILFNKEDNNYIQLYDDQTLIGNSINTIKRVLYKGKWTPNKIPHSFIILNDVDINLFLTHMANRIIHTQIQLKANMEKKINSFQGIEWILHDADFSFNVSCTIGHGLFKNYFIKTSQLIPKKECVKLYKDKIWSNKLDGSYFSQELNCDWTEKSHSGEVTGRYQFVKIADDEPEESLLLLNKQTQMYVKIIDNSLYTGDTMDQVNTLQGVGEWIAKTK